MADFRSLTTRRQILKTLAAGTVLAGAGGLAGHTRPQSGPTLIVQNPLKQLRFTLSWLPTSVDAALVLGVEKGYFVEEGLDVVYERGFGSADSITKVAAGQYDLGQGDPNSMIEFNVKNPGTDLIAIYVNYNVPPFGIFTVKSRGITEPAQLVGKNLGAPAGDAPRRLWPIYARQIGINADDVTWTTMDPQLRETFLVQGTVDGISGFMTSSVPNIVRAGIELDDISLFLYRDSGLNLYGDSIITTSEFANSDPDALAAFVRGYIRSWKDVLSAPAESARELVRVEAAKGGIFDVATEELRMELAFERLFLTPEVQANGLGTIDPERMELAIAEVVNGFDLTTTPTVEQVFRGDFLPPQSERLIS